MRKKSFRSALIAGIAGLIVVLTIGTPAIRPSVSTLPQSVEGETASGIIPRTCVGFNHKKNAWGYEYGLCPSGHAYYGVDDPAGAEGPAEAISVATNCCSLPAEDMLTESHVFATEECPINYIATGAQTNKKSESKEIRLRCTKINTERYQLGEMTPGIYWGDGAAGWKGSKRIAWDNIPAGIRYAQGRVSKDKWDIDGCIGFPWGSVLTKKSSKHCSGFSFRQFQFRGIEGDPLAGTPVKMFAICNDIGDVDDPNGKDCRVDS